jgi:outer membrane protein assembly factor BamE (lipoprotein component of BamABCDE complex)
MTSLYTTHHYSHLAIRISALALAFALAGCAGGSGVSMPQFSLFSNASTGTSLTPGKSRDDDVRADMGAPAEVLDEPGGNKVWFYPKRGWGGRQTFAVRIGSDRVVRAVEQRLTPENVARIVPEKMSERDIRLLLGPPNTIETWPRLNRNIWDYRMNESLTTGAGKVLSVQFSPDGVVREVRYLDDSEVAGNRL